MIPDRLMKSTALAAAAVVMAFLSSAAWPAEPPPATKSQAQMVQDAIDIFIVPRIGTFKERTEALAAAVGKACADDAGPAAGEAAAQAFRETVRAWAPLDFIRFGPAARNHRLERVLFWPDPRATAQRQLNGLLATRRPELLEPGGLATQSVAVQGLTALEALLFSDKKPLGPGGDEAAHYRCGMARAVALGVDTVAGEIRDGWAGPDGYRAKMLNPGPDNALYRDTSESAREIVKALVIGFDLVRDRIALPELNAISRTPPRRARLPFEPSGATGAFVEETIRALKELYDACALAARVGPERQWMVAFLATGWDGLLMESRRFGEVRAGQPGSNDHLHTVRKLRFDVSSIRQIVVKELAANAGIILGFNELDGD